MAALLSSNQLSRKGHNNEQEVMRLGDFCFRWRELWKQLYCLQ